MSATLMVPSLGDCCGLLSGPAANYVSSLSLIRSSSTVQFVLLGALLLLFYCIADGSILWMDFWRTGHLSSWPLFLSP